MNRAHVTYLIVGGGAAADAAVAAVRAVDRVGSLLMVGQEPTRSYDRGTLSKSLLQRKRPVADVFLRPDRWYGDNHVELRTGRRVTSLDLSRRSATLDSGQEISYDRMLLATGSSTTKLPVPGNTLPNLYHVRTLQDVDRLLHAVDAAAGRRVVVIGGGLLGVELAGSMRVLGLDVKLVVGSDHIWPAVAGPTAAGVVERHLQNQSVGVIPRRVTALEGDGRVQRVRLDDGSTIPCDLAVAAVGSTPNKDLLRHTSLPAESAILVDQRCRTVDPAVWAAGDCAAFFDPRFGKHRIVDHWDHAIQSGTVAGTNMAGGDAVCRSVGRFSSDVMGLPVTVSGEPRLVDHRVVRGTGSSLIEFGLSVDRRVTQTLAVGPGHDLDLLDRMIDARTSIESVERLQDPAIDLVL